MKEITKSLSDGSSINPTGEQKFSTGRNAATTHATEQRFQEATRSLMGIDSKDEVHHTNNSAGDFTEENGEVPGYQPTNYRIFQKESTHAGERILLERTMKFSTNTLLREQPHQQSGERGYNHARNMNKCLTLLRSCHPWESTEKFLSILSSL